MDKIKTLLTNNKKLVGAFLFILLILLVIAFSTGNNQSNNKEETDTTPENEQQSYALFLNDGSTVTIRDSETGRLKQASEESGYSLKDVIKTAQGAYALLLIPGESYVLLLPESEVYVDSATAELFQVNVSAGSVWVKATSDLQINSDISETIGKGLAVVKHNDLTSLEVLSGIFFAKPDISDREVEPERLVADQVIEIDEKKLNDYLGGALSKYIKKADQALRENDLSYAFGFCIDDYLTSITLNSTDINNLSVKEGFNACVSIVSDSEEAGSKQLLDFNRVVGEFISSNELRCSWTAPEAEVQGYAYWVGTSPKAFDVFEEAFTDKTEVTIKLTPTSGLSYFCSVRAVSADGVGEAVSGPIVAKSETTNVINNQTPALGKEFTGQVNGMINISGYKRSDLTLQYSIQAQDGRYFDSDAWSTTKLFNEIDIKSDWSYSFTIEEVTDEFAGSILRIELLDSEKKLLADFQQLLQL